MGMAHEYELQQVIYAIPATRLYCFVDVVVWLVGECFAC